MSSNEVLAMLNQLRSEMLKLWIETGKAAQAETCCVASGHLHYMAEGIEQCIDLLHKTQNQVEKDLML